jgi:site-specific DNA recombinase
VGGLSRIGGRPGPRVARACRTSGQDSPGGRHRLRCCTTRTDRRRHRSRRVARSAHHQPFSVGAQETRLAAFVTSQPGWEHVKTYTDQFSGAYAERPALQQALRDARLGLYDTLLVYRVDRFARSLKVLVGLLEELDTIGVAFRSATEPIDTSTATGRMLIQLLGVFAEFERATIIDRVVAGME